MAGESTLHWVIRDPNWWLTPGFWSLQGAYGCILNCRLLFKGTRDLDGAGPRSRPYSSRHKDELSELKPKPVSASLTYSRPHSEFKESSKTFVERWCVIPIATAAHPSATREARPQMLDSVESRESRGP